MIFVNSPFNYTGSKFKLLPQLLPYFDYSKKTFVDVFTGGGSVYANVIDKYDKIVINDIIKDLVGCHQRLGENDSLFIQNVIDYCVPKDNQAAYNSLRDDYNRFPAPCKLFALMLCCTNNMLHFNKSFKFNQTFGKRTFNSKTQEKIDNFIAHVNPFKNKIEYKSVEFYGLLGNDVKNSMYYIDPPYFNTIAGYNSFWSREHEKKLYVYIRQIHEAGGSFCLSGIRGNHKGITQSDVISQLIFDGFEMVDLDFRYNKVSRNKAAEVGEEIIIKNY
jgi:site-specific DNA-adenine methylase